MNIKDIAREAGVSIATVSRVINSTAKVSEEVRERVEKAIKEANYRPNSLARELQQKKTNTIGVIMSAAEIGESSISDSINAIADVLKENGYNMMLANSRFHDDEERDFFNSFQEKRVDGVLYFASCFTESHHELLKNYPIPIVIIGQYYRLLDIPCVIYDDFTAAMNATQFLINYGHKSIGYIGCPIYDEAAGIERKSGYEHALKLNNIPIDHSKIYTGDFSIQSGYLGMEAIMKSTKFLPTAIFAATDYMAIGAMRFLNEQGINVPQDMSVMGFDNVKVAAYFNPALTTIHTDKRAIGNTGAKLLLRIIKGEALDEKKYIVNYELIQRESVARNKKNTLSQ